MEDWINLVENKDIKVILRNDLRFGFFCFFKYFLRYIRESIKPNGNIIKREDISNAYNIFSSRVPKATSSVEFDSYSTLSEYTTTTTDVYFYTSASSTTN